MIRDPGDTEELDRVLLELHVENSSAQQWAQIIDGLHPKQRAFILDDSPRKCILKGRRGGGSFVLAAWLCEAWDEWPRGMSCYIAMSKDHAKSIIWRPLMAMNERYDWGVVFNNLELSATWPNGYRVVLWGAKDRVQVEKMRGPDSGLRRVGIDEAGSFSSQDRLFSYMIKSVLAPQLMDTVHRGGGQIVLNSSPGVSPRGFFFERTTGFDHMGKEVPQWSTHHWTALDNPYVDARTYFLQELKEGGHILDDSPVDWVVNQLFELRNKPFSDPGWASLLPRLSSTFRREYLAVWVRDFDSLIYRPSEANLLPPDYKLPAGHYRYTIGCDVGWDDGNGFSVAAKNMTGPEIYILESYYKPQLSTHQIAEELKALQSRHYNCGEIYVDTGGEGQRLLVDLMNFGVYANAAGKGAKKPRIEYLRSLIENSSLKITSGTCQELLNEWSALVWDEDRTKHREGFVDECSDATLMAVMPLNQLFIQGKPPPPETGSQAEQDAIEEREWQISQRIGRRRAARRRKRLW